MAAVLLCCLRSVPLWGQSPPTINVCDDKQYICLSDVKHKLCVKITVPPGQPAPIKKFEIDWGDGSNPTVVNGSNMPADQFHDYFFNNFYDTCNAITSGKKYVIELLTYFQGIELPTNNSFVVRFFNKPYPRVGFSGKKCINQPITLNNLTCENADTAEYVWDFGPGIGTSILKNPVVKYDTPGLKTIKLCATNRCGERCITTFIEILDKPKITKVNVDADPKSGCKPLKVKMSAIVTAVDKDKYRWSVQGPPGASFAFVPVTAKDSVNPVIQFNTKGNYIVRLIGSNECGSDTSAVTINVFDLPGAAPAPLPAACKTVTLDLKPNYSGSVDSFFWSFPKGSPKFSKDSIPKNIQYSNSGDTILRDTAILRIKGPCGEKTYKIPIAVIGDPTIKFDPIGPICKSNKAFNIGVKPNGGTFSSFPSLPATVLNPVTGQFNPKNVPPGAYKIIYDFKPPGAPADCISNASIDIEIRDSVPLSLIAPLRICLNAPPVTLAFTPVTGGSITGTGITDTLKGIFDPRKGTTGLNVLTFNYKDTATGCSSTQKQPITVMPLPTLKGPDTLRTCAIAGSIKLTDLAQKQGKPFDFKPSGGTATWIGPGVQALTGEFVSPGADTTYTITVKYSDEFNCDTTFVFRIKVDSFRKASALIPPKVCKSQGKYTLIGSPAGGTWSSSTGAVVNATTGIVDLAQTPAGLHQFLYIIQKGTPCESNASITLEVFGGDAVLAGADDYVCETQEKYALPIGSPANIGTWTGPNLNGKEVDVKALESGTYKYAYTVASLPDACNSDTFLLTIAPQPPALFTTDADTVCIGQKLKLFADVQKPEFQYEWALQSQVINKTASFEYVFTKEGDYDINLIVKTLHPLNNTLLCSNTHSQKIHVVAPPKKVAFTYTPRKGCAVLSVSFTNQSIAENGQYSWDFGNGQTYKGFQPNVPILYQQGIEDTFYVVRLRVSTGCDDVAFTDTVFVKPRPRANFGITYNQPCSGGKLWINNTSTGNPQISRWDLLRKGQVFKTYNTFNPDTLVFFTGKDPDTIFVRLIASNECDTDGDTIIKRIIVNPTNVKALFSISDTTALCIGDTLRVTNFSTPGATVDWKDSKGNVFKNNVLDLVMTQSGLQSMTIYARGCGYDSMRMVYYVNPNPMVELMHLPEVCRNASVNIQVKTNGKGAVTDLGDGNSVSTTNFEHRYTTAGIFTLKTIAISEKGCKQAATSQINIKALPKGKISVRDSLCAGETVNLKNEGAGNLNCFWFWSDGVKNDGCEANRLMLLSGTYGVTLTVVEQPLGCRDTVRQTVYVSPTPVAKIKYEILKNCTPAQVRFSSETTNATGIEWDFGDGTMSIENTVLKTYTKGGLVKVRLRAISEGICTDLDEVTLNIYQTPPIDFDLKPACFVKDGTDMEINTASGNWVQVTGPGAYKKLGTLHQKLPEGNYSLQIKSPEGCVADSSGIVILEPQELSLTLAQDSFFLRLGEFAQIDISSNLLKVKYQWSPREYLDSDTVSNPRATPLKAGRHIYTLKATDDRNCSQTLSVFIDVEIERDTGIYIPNAFSPDGDGMNDVFMIRSSNPSLEVISHFIIFDKWGSIVFERRNIQPNERPDGWDGFFKGQKAEAGIYRWQAKWLYKDGREGGRRGAVKVFWPN